MLRLNINGREVTGYEGQTILDVCNANGISVPTLCHDERVKMYGSCGICVVEAEGSPRLLRSCSTYAADGMIIRTNSPLIEETRKTALELLLSDHRGDCRPPCVEACPGKTDCQGYVGLIANGEYREAVELIKDKLPLPACIGRVCPHPCETACRRELVEEPISIASLKYFAADIDLNTKTPFLPDLAPDIGKNVAIIGGGPGGLSSAYFLRRKGVSVTIFDAMPKMGGMLRYGIPEYRLPKSIVDDEVQIIENMGVKLVNNVTIGEDFTLSYLRKNYDAVVVAIGAWKSAALKCPGEDSEGVIGGIDFLREAALGNSAYTGKSIAVVGGGNTAMDACRTAVRLGADKVYNIYRRTKAEMPAEEIEIIEAEEEGVIFKNLTNPAEIIAESGRVSSIKLELMELGEPDTSGRRSPNPTGTFETINVDTVIIAIGQQLQAKGFEELELNKRGNISADEHSFRTNLVGVFAIGDATNKGADIAISAIGEARFSSDVIFNYLQGSEVSYRVPYIVTQELDRDDFSDREKQQRSKMRHLKPKERKSCFKEVNFGYSEQEAVAEAKRCLECGCHDYFECKLIDYANSYDVKPSKYDGYAHLREHDSDNSHPFIHRNPDKCILCGLCVRVCDELIGSTALGLVGRGFDTIIKPSLDLPLRKTECISCGQCITVCPTGALQEVTALTKPVPVKESITHSSCGFCGVGCQMKIASIGNSLIRCLPDDTIDKAAILCAKGRFGAVNNVLDMKRIEKPRFNSSEAELYDAITLINKKIQGGINKHGSKSVKFAVSGKLTNEAQGIIKRYANNLDIETFSFGEGKSGLSAVLGYDGSTASFEELANTGFMLVVEDDLYKSHTVTAIRIRKLAEEGKQLVVINNKITTLSEYADEYISCDNTTNILKQILKALFELGCDPKNTEGIDELKAYVSNSEPSEAIRKIAEAYFKAKQAIIVFEQGALSHDAQLLIAAIGVVSGHFNRPRNGFIQLKTLCNSQGLADAEISMDLERHIAEIENGTTKTLIVFGEEASSVNLDKLEFLAVADSHETETSKKAHCVLPLAMFTEEDGSFTDSFGNRHPVRKAVNPPFGLSNIELLSELTGLGLDAKQGKPNAVSVKIILKVPSGSEMYTQHSNTNALYRKFSELEI